MPNGKISDAANILVVDDTPANLQMLTSLLKECGCRARPVPNGALALQAAKSEPPDLVLLDINLPDMDGYQVCKQIKLDEQLCDIPVIFISAYNEILDKVKAFQAGAVDYITKPFHLEEVKARVMAQLELRSQRLELLANYEKLWEMEKLRDTLVHMIVHDLRSPLGVLLMILELLKQRKKEVIPPEVYSDIGDALSATKKIAQMVNTMLDVSKMEAGKLRLRLSECDVTHLVQQVLEEMKPLGKNHTLEFSPPVLAIQGLLDPELIARTLQNILLNAFKYSPEKTVITVAVELQGREIRVAVSDDGPGIPMDLQEKIFEKFGRIEARQQNERDSYGLGLTFCKLAVEAHGGRIGVESELDEGSTFWFSVPQFANPSVLAVV